MRLRTNAKLNLFLRVAGRRSDGYHELESIFHGVGLGDDIEIEPTSTGEVHVEMTLSDELRGEIPPSAENLASRAAEQLVALGAVNKGLSIRIHKRIPLAAGLGGGSGNAAGIIIALNELWRMDLDEAAVLKAAATVGSDVPYCLSGGTALAMKRGEQLTPLPVPTEMFFVLGISFEPLFTKEVYDRFDTVGSEKEAGSAPMTFALGSGDLDEIASLLHNDLEPAAFSLRPGLESKKEALLRTGAVGASMTGSGPTMFGLATDIGHARSVADDVADEFDLVTVVSSAARCVERLS